MSNKLFKLLSYVVIAVMVVSLCNSNNRYVVFAAEKYGEILLKEDFQETELEKHFANYFLCSKTQSIDGVNVQEFNYDYVKEICNNIDFSRYQSYFIQYNNGDLYVYLFSCNVLTGWSQSSYGKYCRFIYDVDINNVPYYEVIRIDVASRTYSTDGIKELPINNIVENLYYINLDVNYVISTSCAIYDCVEFVDNYVYNTSTFYFDKRCFIDGTDLNRYSVVDTDIVETISNHMYMLSCDVGFCGNDTQGDFSNYNSSYVYLDYQLDKYALAHIDEYMLHMNYMLKVDNLQYTYDCVCPLSADGYYFQSLKDIEFNTSVWSGSCITAFNIDGSIAGMKKRDLSLNSSEYKNVQLIVTFYLTGTTIGLSSGRFSKTFNLVTGVSQITSNGIIENPNPFENNSNSSNSIVGGGVVSAITNSPIFNNNVNVTVEGDTINNDINNIIDNDTTTKKDNDSFIGKFLGFFNLLENNAFLNVFSKIFEWLPTTVLDVFKCAIGIIAGISVIKFFRK